MPAPVAVTAEKRAETELGSRANHRLRKTGQIPAVVYGHHQDTLPVKLSKKELARHIEHGVHVYNLSFDGHAESVLLKDVQYDAFGIEILHADFARVDLNERVTVNVSIELKGEPVGEKDGGVLQQILNELEIECVVTEIPDAITVDVSHLKKDEDIRVSDIKVAAGITVLTDAEQTVAKVEEPEEISDETAEEGAAEPEVIGKAKEDEAAAPAAE